MRCSGSTPESPRSCQGFDLRLRYRRHWGLEIEITRDRVRVSARPADTYPIRIGIWGEIFELHAGASVERVL